MRSRTVYRVIVCALFAAQGFALLLADRGAAQTGDGRYTSPTYGYVVTWDSSLWHIDEETSAGGTDRLNLGDGTTNIYLDGYAGFGGDAAACVTDASGRIGSEDGVVDVQPAVDGNGTAIAGSTSDQAFAMFLVTRNVAANTPAVDLVWYVECHTLVAGSAVLQITVITTRSAYETELPAIQAVFAGIDLSGVGASGTRQTEPVPSAGRAALVITTVDQNGAPLPDACFDITANTGPRYEELATLCDGDDGVKDGRLVLGDLPAGKALFDNSWPPEGYDRAAQFGTAVAADETTNLTVCYQTGTANPDALPTATPAPQEFIDDQGYILARITMTAMAIVRGGDGRVADPPSGSRYLLLTLSIENTGTDPLRLRAEQFVVLDESSFLYAGIDASSLVRDGSGLGRLSLQPGKTAERTVVFELPADSGRPDQVFYQPAADRLVRLAAVDWETANGLCSTGTATGAQS
jgi:hypothetical protein